MSRSKDYERECPCPDSESCGRKDSKGHKLRFVVRYEKPPGPDGVRRQGKRRFKTPAEARQFRAKHITSVADGTYVDRSRERLSQHVPGWLARKARTLKPGPLADYTYRLNRYVLPHIGHVRLCDVRVSTLDDLFDAIGDDDRYDLSATSLHLILAVFSSMMTDAEERGLIGRNPCRLYARNHLPPKSTPKVSPWSPAQTKAFLAHVGSDRYALLWRVYVIFGLRRGEGIGLRWSDVDLDAGTLTIRQAITLAGGRVTTGRPKTAAGENRVVVLDAGTVTELKAHKRRQAAERLRAGGAYEDGGLVFCDEIGRLVHPAAISYRFRTLAVAAGLPRVRLHDLRHGAVSLMIDAGIPLPVVSKLAGHSSLRTTSDLYGHLVDGRAASAVDAVVALLAGAPGA